MMGVNVIHDGVRALFREAATWRIAGLLFERPRDGWHAEVDRLACEPGADRFRVPADAAIAEAVEGSYLRALGPGGTVSPREIGHRRDVDPGRRLASLRSRYEAFGYAPSTEEPPDHVSVEAGFVGFLRLKEAWAHVQGQQEAMTAAAEAVEDFLNEHLRAFADSLAGALDDAGIVYLHLAARELARLCRR